MKKLPATLLPLLLATGLLAGCNGTTVNEAETVLPDYSQPSAPEASEDIGEEEDMEEREGDNAVANDEPITVYRGRVAEMTDDGILVEQLYGYNYGHESILFLFDGDTQFEEGGLVLGEDAFVEVHFNGALTRSLPPQGTADEIVVLSVYAEGMVVNGEVLAVSETDDGYSVTLEVYPSPDEVAEEAEADATDDIPEIEFNIDENSVVINIEAGAFQNMEAGQLVPGAEISVVTKGIAAMSMPPQYPAHVVLPFAP